MTELTKNLILEEALLLQSRVLKLPKPSARVFQVFRNWFERERPFVGYGNDLLKHEFVALNPSSQQDFLSRFLEDFGGRFLPVSSFFDLCSKERC